MGYISSIFPDLQLFESFPTGEAQNDPQWPILPPKWLRLAQNGQFWSFFNFSQVFPKKVAHIDSEWPISSNSQLFQYFPTKSAHFWPNLKFWGGTLAKFFQICNFFNCFQPQWLKMTPNGQFCDHIGSNWPILVNFQLFPGFPQKAAQIDLEWLISPDLQLFQSFPTKAAHFWPNLKIFHFGGGVTSNFGHVKSAISKEAIGLMAQLSM